NGGDLGWVLPNQILPAIGNVLPNLNKCSLAAAPIQSPLGWHIIKLEDKRNFKIPTIEQIKDQIQQSLIQKRQAEFIKKLKENAKIIQ
ncbi:MAG: peptidylprolyl isomerase, partial [Polynucleobacter victoriensis]